MVKKVQVLKTPGCSSCAQATKLVKKIKQEENLKFKLEEIDITEQPELVEKYQIMVSPGIVIDGKLAFSGVPNEKELKKKLTG